MASSASASSFNRAAAVRERLWPRAALFVLLAAVPRAIPATSAAHVWYVDCASGNDASDGASPSTAWRTTSKASGKVYGPGDAVLFRRGSVCQGMLSPKGSGTTAAPIRLDAFGAGPLPRIEAVQGEKAALILTDQEYWTVQHLEFSGGDPYGVLVTGTDGVLHGIRIRDTVVHDVTGEPKAKQSGLLVITPGSASQRFDDILVDGVTAYHTSQWAGILIGGDSFGYHDEKDRSTNIVVRNSIVADVAGDGIVLFGVNNGLIENSVAWYTGMQHTEKIGTPNAIWTWMCRDCTVRRSEAFLVDSPGVDGGAFDIDYGDENNVVEESYGHDTQGYCIAVFGAGWVTKNSVVRNNVCSGNGRSPRLARRQGAVFLDTWNDGSLQGVEFTGNRIFWNPPIATAAVVNTAKFIGEGSFAHNTLESGAPFLRSNSSLRLDHNSFRSPGETAQPRSIFVTAYLSGAPDDHDSRGQLALLTSLHRQFPDLPVRIVAIGTAEPAANLGYDWNIRDIPISFEPPALHFDHLPAVTITDSSGKVLWKHAGITPPGDLGLEVRSFHGNPDFSTMSTQP
jgi:hypothetical protein